MKAGPHNMYVLEYDSHKNMRCNEQYYSVVLKERGQLVYAGPQSAKQKQCTPLASLLAIILHFFINFVIYNKGSLAIH